VRRGFSLLRTSGRSLVFLAIWWDRQSCLQAGFNRPFSTDRISPSCTSSTCAAKSEKTRMDKLKHVPQERPKSRLRISSPSALARNDPTLLARSDPAPRRGEHNFVQLRTFLPTDKCRIKRSRRAPQDWSFSTSAGRYLRKLNALRACGADDGTATRTPSAWMISPLLLCPRANPAPNRVLGVGHSKRAEVGHSCRAPKFKSA
jgi:hypothetical protein